MLFNVPFDDMRMRFCVYNTNIRIMCGCKSSCYYSLRVTSL